MSVREACLGFWVNNNNNKLLTSFLICSQSVMKVPKRPEYDSSARHCVWWVVESVWWVVECVVGCRESVCGGL